MRFTDSTSYRSLIFIHFSPCSPPLLTSRPPPRSILHLCLHAHPLPIHSPNCGQGYISKMKILSCYCSPEIPRMVATWLIMVVVANLYAFSKSHRTAQLKRVNFTVCKLHLNKSDFKNLCHRHCSPGKNRTFHRVMVLHSRLDIPSQPGAAWIQSPAL